MFQEKKIDLSQFDKPKKQVITASQQTDADGIKRDKKKRRRIKQAPTSNIAKPTLVGDANHQVKQSTIQKQSRKQEQELNQNS